MTNEIEIRPTEVHELEDSYGDLSNAEQSKQFTEYECASYALNDIGEYITNQSDSVSKLSQPSTEQKIDIVKIGACQPRGPCVKFPKTGKVVGHFLTAIITLLTTWVTTGQDSGLVTHRLWITYTATAVGCFVTGYRSYGKTGGI